MSFPSFESLPVIHELPDPFLKRDGSRVNNPAEWQIQREYLKALLSHYLYGTMPSEHQFTGGSVLFSRFCYNGKAIAETVEIIIVPGVSFKADILRPANKGKVPVITWNQFRNRHGCPEEEEIVVKRGYAIAEFDREQLAEDSPAAMVGQLSALFPDATWGAITMWAWMQSRLIDYLATTEYADMNKIVATGHSRGGKAALCAAIFDERIAVCAPNGSGCGGAGCFRFLGGRMGEGTAVCETVGIICDTFPFWWADEFSRFGFRMQTWTRSTCQKMYKTKAIMIHPNNKPGNLRNENKLPFDLHTAKALIAPRALITTDALSDNWANVFGTHITWRAAQEVFDFLGVPDRNAIHFREGGHEFQSTDWLAIVDFCDSIFFGSEKSMNVLRFKPTKERPGELQKSPDVRDWPNYRLHYTWCAPIDEENK